LVAATREIPSKIFTSFWQAWAWALRCCGLIIPVPTHNQDGKKDTNSAASPTPGTRPRQSTKSLPQPPIMPVSSKSSTNAPDDPDVVKVSSHLVPGAGNGPRCARALRLRT
jgi:hypothetical protein